MLGVSVFFLLLFVYPYIIYPQVLRMFKPYQSHSELDHSKRKFALFFSAYNEEAQIQKTIDWLEQLKQKWPDLDILAYDDCSSDQTASMLAASKSIQLIKGTSRKGKPHGIRKLISLSKADIGIFIDANIIADVTSVLNFKRYFKDPEIGSVGARLTYIDGQNTNEEIGNLYWQIEENLKSLETKTGNTVGADGSMFATRLASYPDFPDDNADDFRVSMESLFLNQRCITADDILVYEASTSNTIDEFYRKKRIACGAFAAHRDMWTNLIQLNANDQFKYYSHRFLRWNGAILLWISGIFALMYTLQFENKAYLYTGIFVIGFISILIPKLRRLTLKVVNILIAIHAIQIGIFENILGKSYKTWQPAQSRQNDRLKT